jgi:hypothetical protein
MTSENQRFGHCDDDAKTCEALREVSKSKWSPCVKTSQVACFHIAGLVGLPEECLPTMTHCIAVRANLPQGGEIHATDECTMRGIAPAAPAQH